MSDKSTMSDAIDINAIKEYRGLAPRLQLPCNELQWRYRPQYLKRYGIVAECG